LPPCNFIFILVLEFYKISLLVLVCSLVIIFFMFILVYVWYHSEYARITVGISRRDSGIFTVIPNIHLVLIRVLNRGRSNGCCCV
jgi:hypothetical protein